jgi:hypothetical protein
LNEPYPILTDLARSPEISGGAREDTSVKGGKGTRAGVAHRHLLKAGCNISGIGYMRRPTRLITVITAVFYIKYFLKTGGEANGEHVYTG